MLSVCIGSNDIARSRRFYDAVLAHVGFQRGHSGESEVGYGPPAEKACLWILRPYDGRPATWGNGMQVSFRAPSREAVDAFHAAALAQGGMDEGKPGLRDYRPGYYGAYCRDPDGNKLHVVHDGG